MLASRLHGVAQLARFACVGVSNTLLSYAVYAGLIWAGAPYVAAGALGFALGAVNGYRLNRRWTFRAADSTRRRIRYVVVQLASLGATTNLLWLVVSVGGVHRLVGYLLTVPVVTVASFVANRAWTFQGSEPNEDQRKEKAMWQGLLRTANGEPWRILVVANETVTSSVLHEAIALRADEVPAQVLVVAPALNGRLQHWASDEDRARQAAEERLSECLARLSLEGIDANGQVGDADPLLAIADALRLFPADEIMIATNPEGRSNWLARNLVGAARARFEQPILHVVAGERDDAGRAAETRDGSRIAAAAA